MGTRSDIIVHMTNGQWARIYCHWDGYLEHNGRTQKPMRRFTIDGTTEHGELSGHATRGPWAVFDAIKQDWLITGLPYWRAVLICRLLTKSHGWKGGI